MHLEKVYTNSLYIYVFIKSDAQTVHINGFLNCGTSWAAVLKYLHVSIWIEQQS